MKRGEHSGELWQIVIMTLSVYVLGALLVESSVRTLPTEVARVLQITDFAICLVFLGDFGVRFAVAPSKLRFMRWGWIDLVCSIPAFDSLRWGRLIRVIRIVRAIRSVKILAGYIVRNRARGAMVSVALASFLTLSFSSIAILNIEDQPNSNIKTAGDALWWSITTITTVGYGDRFPVTPEGRAVAVVLMIMGIATFGTLTAFLARYFFEEEEKQGDLQVAALRVEIRELKELLEKSRGV